MGRSHGRPSHPARLSYSVWREAVESRTTCWAASCLLPHRKRNLLHADLGLLKCHFLSVRYDGVCCWWRWRYGGTEATTALSHTSCLLGNETRKGCGNKTRKTDGKPIQQLQHTYTHANPGYNNVVWEKHTKCSILFETAWIVYLFSVKVTQNYPPFCPHCTLAVLTPALSPP